MQSDFEKAAMFRAGVNALRGAGRGIKALLRRAEHSNKVRNVVPDPSPRNHFISRATAAELEAPAADVARQIGLPSKQQILKRQAIRQQEQFADMYPKLNKEIHENHLNWGEGQNNAGLSHYQGPKVEPKAPNPNLKSYDSLLEAMSKRHPRTGRHNY